MVQVFLPYESASLSIEKLDLIRLGKQREEILEILEAITNPRAIYQLHPTVTAWRPFAGTLCSIGMMSCVEYKRRRGVDTALKDFFEYMDDPGVGTAWVTPPWFGDLDFHQAHRSRLIRKKPDNYGPLWPGTPVNMPYLYPRISKRDPRGYTLHLSQADLGRLVQGQRVLPAKFTINPETLEVTE